MIDITVSFVRLESMAKIFEIPVLLRLFWCITLALIPLAMNFIGASMGTLQTITIIASIPFIFVMIGMTIGMSKWLKEDRLKEKDKI